MRWLWKFNGLPTHGENDGELIGTELDMTDSWHDDAQEVGSSSGTCADTVVKLEDAGLYPLKWHAHPSQAVREKLHRFRGAILEHVASCPEPLGEEVGSYQGARLLIPLLHCHILTARSCTQAR